MIGISLHIYDVWEIQNSVQKILEKEIFAIPAEAGFNNQSFISAADNPHYIACAIGIIDALEKHLLLCNILCIPHDFREHEYTFTLNIYSSSGGAQLQMSSNFYPTTTYWGSISAVR